MIEIEVEQISLNDTLRMLAALGGGTEIALSRAINKTLPGLQTESNKAVREDLNVKAGTVKETFTKKNASPSKLVGYLRSTGKPIPFMSDGKLNFSGKKLPKGYGFTIKKDRGRKKFTSAFYAKMRSGKENIWVRPGGKTKTGRQKIKGLYTTRISDIIDNKETNDRLRANAAERMQTNLENQIEYLINK